MNRIRTQLQIGRTSVRRILNEKGPPRVISSIQFHKIWIEQCEAAEGISERFGPDDALHYLIGEKLFSFAHASEEDPDFSAELPAFVA